VVADTSSRRTTFGVLAESFGVGSEVGFGYFGARKLIAEKENGVILFVWSNG
jgi:hypothetical protein